MVRVALVDDQNLFRKGMALLLRSLPDVEVALECSNGRELLDALAERPVDIVLLDLEMPVMDGISTLGLLRQKHPDLKIIVLSMHEEEKFIVHMMELGANGYIMKTARTEEIGTAIRSVMGTGYHFSERVSRVMLHGLVKKEKVRPTFDHTTPLSEREREVLLLICKEHTTPEIAEMLFLSPRTVDTHRTNILQKTGARNTAGLAVYAITHGLYEP